MPTEAEQVIRSLRRSINAGDEEAVAVLISAECRVYCSADLTTTGPEAYVEAVRADRAGFPDLEQTTEELFSKGDKVVERWIFRGTHNGEFAGIAPTGRRVEFMVTTIYRVAEGKIVEERNAADLHGLFRQIRDP